MGSDFGFVGPTVIISVMIPVVFMLCAVAIVIFSIHRRFKVRELEHQERLAAIEKGYEIPSQQPAQKPKSHYPFAWPFVFMGVGVALIITYIVNVSSRHYTDPEGLGFGLTFLFIGGGLFLSRIYGVRKEEMDKREEAAVNNIHPNRPGSPEEVRSMRSSTPPKEELDLDAYKPSAEPADETSEENSKEV